jgi:hypothetical protein
MKHQQQQYVLRLSNNTVLRLRKSHDGDFLWRVQGNLIDLATSARDQLIQAGHRKPQSFLSLF